MINQIRLHQLKKLFKIGAGLGYFAVLFYIFFLARRRLGHVLPWNLRPYNLMPLRNKFHFFTEFNNLSDASKWNFFSDFFGNILLFIPFVFFVETIFKITSYKKLLRVALFTSFSVEIIQYVFSIGVADIDDVILNVTGALTGCLLLAMQQRLSGARE